MNVTLETPTPFAAVVRTNHSKKAAKGTPVTVAKIFDGNWGPCAICYTEDSDKIFLSPGNLTYKGEADAKAVEAIDAEAEARRAHGERRVEVGEPSWSNDKCVAFDWTAEITADPTLARMRGGTMRVRLFFPRNKRNGTPLFDNGTVPGWLWNIKVREASAELPHGFEITEKW
jgi:hypothetical protein